MVGHRGDRISALAWATGSYLSSRIPLPEDAFVATAFEMLAGGVLLLPFGLAQTPDPSEFSATSLAAFAYLIPAVMLFRVGDFAAMLAVVAYSIVPPVRYTDHGIRQIDPALIEAARAAGCTRRQLLRKVQLPLALPEIMLGVNQTIMMALSMLVITALVGTRELGQEVYIALTKADVGRGLVAGICVACIAMTADRLIAPWAAARKRRLGIG